MPSRIDWAKCAALLAAATAVLSACSTGSKPDYCQEGIVERGARAGGTIGIFVSAIMELGCIDIPEDEEKRQQQDEAKVSEYFKKLQTSASCGKPEDQHYLGLKYMHGSEPAEEDVVEAYKWFRLAASQGYPIATEYSDKLAERMSAEQISEAMKLVADWEPDADSCEAAGRELSGLKESEIRGESVVAARVFCCGGPNGSDTALWVYAPPSIHIEVGEIAEIWSGEKVSAVVWDVAG